ncbi:10425_t:CDS:2, partial [Entrophospora sp. SA101]
HDYITPLESKKHLTSSPSKIKKGNDDINVATIDNASSQYNVSNYLWNLVFELEEEEVKV